MDISKKHLIDRLVANQLLPCKVQILTAHLPKGNFATNSVKIGDSKWKKTLKA